MKKFIIGILLLALLTPMLFSCDGDKTDSSGSQPQEETSIDPSTIFLVPKTDLGSRTFNILCWDFGYGSNSILGYSGEVLYNEEKPDSVDDAKKKVIDIVEERFNCTITGEMVYGTQSIPSIVRNQVEAGLNEYDFVFDQIFQAAPLVAEGKLLNLYDIGTIDFEQPWWDHNAVEDLTIGGKAYFAAGDINTYDNQGTWCVLFNKTLKQSLGIEEDFYQMVRDKEWTFDNFVEICSRPGVTRELNGDGVLDENDQWAFGTESYNMYVQLVGGGIKICEKDENDLPYLTLSRSAEATYTHLGKILDFYNRHDLVMVANFSNYANKGFQNVWEATVHKAFIEGRELFYMCGLINAASFRTMEDEFGILPIPMLTDTQDSYHHTISVQNSTVLFIPDGVEDPEAVGTVISALSEESRKYVTPAYYDVQLKYRDTRDNESGEMLDLIFSTRTFDVGAAYNWGGILGAYMGESADNLVSRFQTILPSVETKLEETVEAIENMGK